MLLLSTIRIVYHIAYDSFVDPMVQLCASKIRPWNFQNGANNDVQDGININFRLVIEDENAAENNENADNNADNADNVDQGAADVNNAEENAGDQLVDGDIERDRLRAVQVAADLNLLDMARRREVEDNQEEDGFFTRLVIRAGNYILDQLERAMPAERDEQRQMNGVADPDEIIIANGADAVAAAGAPIPDEVEGNNAQEEPLHIRRHRNADWVISPRSLSLRIGNTLLWPLIGGIVGGLLSKSPLIRKICPGRFNRNILGSLLVVFIRDIINVSSAFLRVRQENSRKIIDYQDLPRQRTAK